MHLISLPGLAFKISRWRRCLFRCSYEVDISIRRLFHFVCDYFRLRCEPCSLGRIALGNASLTPSSPSTDSRPAATVCSRCLTLSHIRFEELKVVHSGRRHRSSEGEMRRPEEFIHGKPVSDGGPRCTTGVYWRCASAQRAISSFRANQTSS